MKRPSPGIDCCCWSILLLSLAQAVPVARGPNSGESQRLEAANSNYVDLNKVCLYETAVYAEGQNFTTSNPCETCICHPPAFACSLRTCDMRPGCKAIHSANKCCPEYSCECERNGKTYGNGEKVEEPNDPCKICYCKGGEMKCSEITCYTREDCEPIYTPGICCPKYDHCPLLENLKNQTNTPKPSLVIISDLSTPGALENKNTSSEETSSEEQTESPKPDNSTQSQTVATLEIIEIHPNLSTMGPTFTRPKFHPTTKAPEEPTMWTESGSIATEEVSNDFDASSTEVTEANDTQSEVSTVPFDVKDLPPIDSNDLNWARMRNQSDENDTLSEESEVVEASNSTSADEDYERMENSTSDSELPARIEGEVDVEESATGTTTVDHADLRNEESSTVYENSTRKELGDEESATEEAATEDHADLRSEDNSTVYEISTRKGLGDEESASEETTLDHADLRNEESSTVYENSTRKELGDDESATEEAATVDHADLRNEENSTVYEISTRKGLGDDESATETTAIDHADLRNEENSTDYENSTRKGLGDDESATETTAIDHADLRNEENSTVYENSTRNELGDDESATEETTDHADLRNKENSTVYENGTKNIEKESMRLGDDESTTEETSTVDHADLRNEETSTVYENSTKNIEKESMRLGDDESVTEETSTVDHADLRNEENSTKKESMQLGDDVTIDNLETTTEAGDEDLIERITIEDLVLSTMAPLVESTTVTEIAATTEIEEETTARYVASAEISFHERLEMTTVTFSESTTDIPSTTFSDPPKLSGRMISDDTTDDSLSEEVENLSSANDSTEIDFSAEELTTKRPAVYSTYAPMVDRITVVPPEKMQEEATTESSGEKFENASLSEQNYEFENGTSGESSEDTFNSTNVPFKFPTEDGQAAPVLMISADQIQFLKVGEEPPLYMENPSSSVPQENNKKNHEEIIVPKTTPLTVQMIKVVNGKIENQTEEIDLTTEFPPNRNSTKEYLVSETDDSISTEEDDSTTKEILSSEEDSSNVTGIIQER